MDRLPPPGACAADVQYVEQAYAALHPAMAASRTAAAEGSRPEVRALARDALAQQTTELVAITACLREWERGPALGPHPDAPTLRSLTGAALDEAFADVLTAHAHAAKTAARTHTENGTSRRVRDLAQTSIRTQALLLFALTRVKRSAVQA